MTVFALHGFLGAGSDFQPLMHRIADLRIPVRWHCPDLLRSLVQYPLSHFAELAEALNREAESIRGPKVLMGYSLGGRVALHMYMSRPDLWEEVIFLSTHFGLDDSQAQRERLLADEAWSKRFLNSSWTELMESWNGQDVFQGDQGEFSPREEEFDRRALASALQNLSLGRQPCWQQFKEKLFQPNVKAIVGGRDEKFLRLCNFWKANGIINDFGVIPNRGHRLLWDPSDELVRRLVDGWKL